MKCQTMGCRRPLLPNRAMCAICALEIELYYGRAGFGPHGREASELYREALAALEAKRLPDNDQVSPPL
jgi:hypothetical protein